MFGLISRTRFHRSDSRCSGPQVQVLALPWSPGHKRLVICVWPSLVLCCSILWRACHTHSAVFPRTFITHKLTSYSLLCCGFSVEHRNRAFDQCFIPVTVRRVHCTQYVIRDAFSGADHFGNQSRVRWHSRSLMTRHLLYLWEV